jgi:hypothetical protein
MGVDASKARRWSKDSAGTREAFAVMSMEILEKRRIDD